ncbi:MAG: glycosyltransferase family A protein [Planctomycetota bacterium]
MADPRPPTATCVVPCFNHGRFVGEAVASCLAQRDAEVDVVLIDDGSDDGSTPTACDALAGDRVRVVHQANRGLPAARNAGAALAQGEFLVFLDADDWIEPAFVATLHAALDAASRADEKANHAHAYCQERLTERGNNVVWRVPEWDPILLMVTNLHPVTALVRRDRFEAAGGFDEAMTDGYEDWDLWLRFAALGWSGVRVREPLFNWRRHAEQTMIDDAVARHEGLYRRLCANHSALYERHAVDVAARANALLRAGDAHWVDETGVPIELQYLRAIRDAYHESGAIAAARRADAALGLLPAPVRRAAKSLAARLARRGPNALRHPSEG